jgi:hypothetical protein
MTEEIVTKPKMLNLFEAMDQLFETEHKRMQQIREQMDKSLVSLYDFNRSPVIKMGNMDDFQKSIEEFKEKNPEAKITARAYTFSTENPEQNKVFEYSNNQPKLPEKKEKKAIKKKTKKK